MLTEKTLLKYKRLTRSEEFTLVQLRIGKIELRNFLFSMNITDSSTCPCGLGNQTTNHVLLECPRHEDLRQFILW
jgi:hypothetical protein